MRYVLGSRITFLLLCGIVAASTGCGNGLKTYPVKGRILVDDRPAAGARVTFLPIDGTAPPDIPRYPSARADQDGYFALTMSIERDGAPAGKYKVVVVWPNGGRADGSGEGEEGDRLQGRYAVMETTPLEAEVKSKSNDLPPFILK